MRNTSVSHFGYLVTPYLISKVVYLLLYELPRRRLRQIISFGVLGAAVFTFVVLSFLMEVLTALLILLVFSSVASLAWIVVRKLRTSRMRREAQSLTEIAQSTYTEGTFTSWQQWPVDASTREAIERNRESIPGKEIVIGHFDNDARVLGLFGPLPGMENVDENEFVERHGYPIDIVLVDDKVLVRKDFQGNRAGFIREWCCLVKLYGKANVPAVYQVSEHRCRLYKNLIWGRSIRDMLVDAGAQILKVQTNNDPALAEMNAGSRIEAVWARAQKLIPKCLTEEFLCELEEQMNQIHACRVTGFSLTHGNIIVDACNGVPWFVDFDRARVHQSNSILGFSYWRDQDRVKFNQIYGRDVVTERSVRAALSSQVARVPQWCAPIGSGGSTGWGLWTVGAGTGCWDFFNRQVLKPLLPGKRVLDLGTKNGVRAFMMLRDGAKEVVGVESSEHYIENAKLVHKIYEWRDLRRYNFHIYRGDMLDISHMDCGEFDLVTAFSSLCYLESDDMARVVRKASELAPVMLLQARTDTRLDTPGRRAQAEKSSIQFLKKLLEHNGFPHVEVHSLPGVPNFNRPFLVGRKKC